MEQTIELPAFRRSAELAPNSIDPETRSVEVIWSTGARVRRAALFGEPHDEELSMAPEHVRLERLNAGAPFLKVHEAHDLDAVIGSVVPGSARIENGQGIARIRLSERDAVGDIWRDIEAGHIRAVSIGYQVHRFEVSKPEAARELWRAVDWTPFEVSAVPVGADPAAGSDAGFVALGFVSAARVCVSAAPVLSSIIWVSSDAVVVVLCSAVAAGVSVLSVIGDAPSLVGASRRWRTQVSCSPLARKPAAGSAPTGTAEISKGVQSTARQISRWPSGFEISKRWTW